MHWPSGNRYEGEFRDGLHSGQGVKTWANGSRYEGAWANNKLNGFGTVTYLDGRLYQGTWTNGCYKQGDRWATANVTAEECGFK